MADVVALVLTTLAVARVVRFLVADGFPPMVRVRSWFGARGDWQEYLMACPWCVGVWVSAAAVGALDAVRSVPVPVYSAGAVAFVAAWVVAIESHDEPEAP